jgi:hypothetical protein
VRGSTAAAGRAPLVSSRTAATATSSRLGTAGLRSTGSSRTKGRGMTAAAGKGNGHTHTGSAGALYSLPPSHFRTLRTGVDAGLAAEVPPRPRGRGGGGGGGWGSPVGPGVAVLAALAEVLPVLDVLDVAGGGATARGRGGAGEERLGRGAGAELWVGSGRGGVRRANGRQTGTSPGTTRLARVRRPPARARRLHARSRPPAHQPPRARHALALTPVVASLDGMPSNCLSRNWDLRDAASASAASASLRAAAAAPTSRIRRTFKAW